LGSTKINLKQNFKEPTMSDFDYKHFQPWKKFKLERLIENKPIFEPIYGMTNKG
jgi:hypothetical protein